MSETTKQMTRDEMIELLRQRTQEWATTKRIVSFGKAPKDGWKDSDRVPAK